MDTRLESSQGTCASLLGVAWAASLDQTVRPLCAVEATVVAPRDFAGLVQFVLPTDGAVCHRCRHHASSALGAEEGPNARRRCLGRDMQAAYLAARCSAIINDQVWLGVVPHEPDGHSLSARGVWG